MSTQINPKVLPQSQALEYEVNAKTSTLLKYNAYATPFNDDKDSSDSDHNEEIEKQPLVHRDGSTISIPIATEIIKWSQMLLQWKRNVTTTMMHVSNRINQDSISRYVKVYSRNNKV